MQAAWLQSGVRQDKGLQTNQGFIVSSSSECLQLVSRQGQPAFVFVFWLLRRIIYFPPPSCLVLKVALLVLKRQLNASL